MLKDWGLRMEKSPETSSTKLRTITLYLRKPYLIKDIINSKLFLTASGKISTFFKKGLNLLKQLYKIHTGSSQGRKGFRRHD